MPQHRYTIRPRRRIVHHIPKSYLYRDGSDRAKPDRSEERRVGKECRTWWGRRHTRFSRDWSSDVCSSDLAIVNPSVISFSRIRRSSSSTEVGSISIIPSNASASLYDSTSAKNSSSHSEVIPVSGWI